MWSLLGYSEDDGKEQVEGDGKETDAAPPGSDSAHADDGSPPSGGGFWSYFGYGAEPAASEDQVGGEERSDAAQVREEPVDRPTHVDSSNGNKTRKKSGGKVKQKLSRAKAEDSDAVGSTSATVSSSEVELRVQQSSSSREEPSQERPPDKVPRITPPPKDDTGKSVRRETLSSKRPDEKISQKEVASVRRLLESIENKEAERIRRKAEAKRSKEEERKARLEGLLQEVKRVERELNEKRARVAEEKDKKLSKNIANRTDIRDKKLAERERRKEEAKSRKQRERAARDEKLRKQEEQLQQLICTKERELADSARNLREAVEERRRKEEEATINSVTTASTVSVAPVLATAANEDVGKGKNTEVVMTSHQGVSMTSPKSTNVETTGEKVSSEIGVASLQNKSAVCQRPRQVYSMANLREAIYPAISVENDAEYERQRGVQHFLFRGVPFEAYRSVNLMHEKLELLQETNERMERRHVDAMEEQKHVMKKLLVHRERSFEKALSKSVGVGRGIEKLACLVKLRNQALMWAAMATMVGGVRAEKIKEEVKSCTEAQMPAEGMRRLPYTTDFYVSSGVRILSDMHRRCLAFAFSHWVAISQRFSDEDLAGYWGVIGTLTDERIRIGVAAMAQARQQAAYVKRLAAGEGRVLQNVFSAMEGGVENAGTVAARTGEGG